MWTRKRISWFPDRVALGQPPAAVTAGMGVGQGSWGSIGKRTDQNLCSFLLPGAEARAAAWDMTVTGRSTHSPWAMPSSVPDALVKGWSRHIPLEGTIYELACLKFRDSLWEILEIYSCSSWEVVFTDPPKKRGGKIKVLSKVPKWQPLLQ